MSWLQNPCKYYIFDSNEKEHDILDLEQKIRDDSPEITRVNIGINGMQFPQPTQHVRTPRLYERLGNALTHNTNIQALRIHVWSISPGENLTPLLRFIESSTSLREVELTAVIMDRSPDIDHQIVLSIGQAIARNTSIQAIGLDYLPILFHGFLNMLRSAQNHLQHLKLYKTEFIETQDDLDPRMILESCFVLTNLSTLTLGLPFVKENDNSASETILQAMFQNTPTIEKLLLKNDKYHTQRQFGPEDCQLILQFIQNSESLKHMSFHGFKWTEEQDVSHRPLDFGPVAEAIHQSRSIAEIAFRDCYFYTPMQIQHFKSVFQNANKPRSLILGQLTFLDVRDEVVEDDNSDVNARDVFARFMEMMMKFLSRLIISSPGLCCLDVREFCIIESQVPSRHAILDALTKETSAAAKSISLGALCSKDCDALLQNMRLFSNLKSIQFELNGDQEVRYKTHLFQALFRDIQLHHIDTCAPMSHENETGREKKGQIFAKMIGERNKQLLELLLDFSHENKMEIPSRFLPFILDNALRCAHPMYLRGSFQSLLRLKVEPSSYHLEDQLPKKMLKSEQIP